MAEHSWECLAIHLFFEGMFLVKNGVVYLAGKISGLSYEDAIKWRAEAAQELKRYGFSVLDPTLASSTKEMTSKSIVENNKYQIRHSDLVLAEFNYEDLSLGTFGEIVFAKGLGLPVVVWGCSKHTVHPWVQEHITVHFKKLTEAVEHIIGNYYRKFPPAN